MPRGRPRKIKAKDRNLGKIRKDRIYDKIVIPVEVEVPEQIIKPKLSSVGVGIPSGRGDIDLIVSKLNEIVEYLNASS